MLRRLFIFMLGWLAFQALMGYLFRSSRRRMAGDRRHFLVTQGGAQYRPTPAELADAVLSVFMGGVVMDLRDAQLTDRPARIDTMVLMGGVQVVVPEDWVVQLDVRPMFGGVRDARHGAISSGAAPDVVLTGRVIMGGIEVTSQLPAEQRQAAQRGQQAA